MNRVLVAAPHSGSGKTTFCMGLMAALVRRGLVVQPFKVGPDYIDTAYHTRICGRPASNLDRWLTGRDMLRTLFTRHAGDADLSVIEGVMGLYDGMGDSAEYSSAEVARELRVPVLLVVDAGGMAASAAALVKGFQAYDPEVPIGGVVFNRVGGDAHYQLLRRAVERDCGVQCFGFLPHGEEVEISSRHLGLLPETELADGEARLERLADLVEAHTDVGGILRMAAGAPPMDRKSAPVFERIPCRLAVAMDKAFHFYYQDGLAVLEAMGAQLIRFSPLKDTSLPACDGVYLGGGFPEVFAAELEANGSMRRSIAEASTSGMPILGECGGYMYLTGAIADAAGKHFGMCGALPGAALMGSRLSRRFGYVEVTLRMETPLGPEGTRYHAHEFHHSEMEAQQTVLEVRKAASGATWTDGTLSRNTLGTYAHVHFAGEPHLAAHFLKACQTYGNTFGTGDG